MRPVVGLVAFTKRPPLNWRANRDVCNVLHQSTLAKPSQLLNPREFSRLDQDLTWYIPCESIASGCNPS
jgi:hypothetical protein